MKLDFDTESAIGVLRNATTKTNLVKEMGKFGFKMPEGEYSSKGLVWVGKNFVVKVPFLLEKKGKPKSVAPQKRLGTICNLAGWVAQARCEPLTRKEWKATMAGETFSQAEQDMFDLHLFNVGRYNGKIVAFDW